MFVKAYTGTGRWRMRDVPSDRSIEWSTHLISVPCIDRDGSVNWDFFADDRMPDAESGELLIVDGGHVLREHTTELEQAAHPDAPAMRFFRWVKWDTGDGPHVMVGDGPVFICNDRGDTVEALR